MIDVLGYIQKKGWAYKEVVGNEIVIKDCPECSDSRWHFYISKDEGLCHCKKCDFSCNLYQLQEKLGDLPVSKIQRYLGTEKTKPIENYEQYERNLSLSIEGQNYLESRGYTEETIKHFRLGFDDGWITIPHFQGGKVLNIKFRKISPKTFKRVVGKPSILFNLDGIDFEKPSVLLVESETDAIAAWQMGVKNVLALTTGATTCLPEWIEILKQFKKTFILLNSDEAGRRGSYKIAEKIGFAKCWNMVLPVKDVNDFLLKYSAKDFLRQFAKTKRFQLKEIISIGESFDKMREWAQNKDQFQGTPTGIESLDSLIGGLKEEELIILSGDSGIGKTTLALNLLLNALFQNKRCLAFLLEGKLYWWISRLLTMHLDKPYDTITTEEWGKTKSEFRDFPLYFFSGSQAELTPQKLIQIVEACIKLYDIDFLVLDNLGKIVPVGDEYVARTSRTVSTLKNLAVDLKIPILLICHIRKPAWARKVIRPTMHDLKSSSTIYQDADLILMLMKEDDSLSLEVQKNRTGECGKVNLNFETSTGKICEKSFVTSAEEK